MEIFELLEKKEGFSSSEESLADYIINNKDSISVMSIKELSVASYVSTSTITRFCKKMGYEGFPEFKVDLAQQLSKSVEREEKDKTDPNFPYKKHDSIYEIARKTMISRQEAMEECYRYIDQGDYIRCRDLILNARRIVIFARGENYTKALAFQDQLMKIGINVILNTIPMEDDHLALTLDKKDVAIVITFSGSTQDIIKTTSILNYNKVPIISITAKPKGFVAISSAVALRIPYKESQSIKFSNYISQSAIDYILNILYAYLFVSNFDESAQRRIDDEVYLIAGRRK